MRFLGKEKEAYNNTDSFCKVIAFQLQEVKKHLFIENLLEIEARGEMEQLGMANNNIYKTQ